jgi:DNA-directed RNA polymerase I, II, and III subunit RPABC2
MSYSQPTDVLKIKADDSDVEAEHDVGADSDVEAKSEVDAKSDVGAKSDVDSDIDADSEVDLDSEVDPESEVEEEPGITAGGAGATSKATSKAGAKASTTSKAKATSKLPNEESSSDSSSNSGSESDDEDDNYLQKFSQTMREDLILNFHPESRSHNYEEIKQLAKVTKNKNGIIVDELHKTIPLLTKYEKTRILGQRAKQIESGATALVQVPPNVIDSYLIAKLELAQRKIPFIIRRPLPNGGMEYWYVSDLEDV